MKKTTLTRKYDVDKLKVPAVRQALSDNLQHQNPIQLSNDVNELWSNMKSSMQKACEETLGFTKHKPNPWISEATMVTRRVQRQRR